MLTYSNFALCFSPLGTCREWFTNGLLPLNKRPLILYSNSNGTATLWWKGTFYSSHASIYFDCMDSSRNYLWIFILDLLLWIYFGNFILTVQILRWFICEDSFAWVYFLKVYFENCIFMGLFRGTAIWTHVVSVFMPKTSTLIHHDSMLLSLVHLLNTSAFTGASLLIMLNDLECFLSSELLRLEKNCGFVTL